MSMMMKMLADMAGITPEQIQETIADIQSLAKSGVAELEQINKRLAKIENKMGINEERPENEESGIGSETSATDN